MKCKRYALSELAIIKYGKNQKKVLSEDGNIPIYGTGGLMGYATTALYDKPSILIGRKGTIGKVKYVEHPFWTVDTLFYTIINTDIVIPKYLYYVMSLIDLNNYNEGTTIPSLRTETLNRLEFDIPSIEEQEIVISCLNPIDKKIELNNAINNNLEQQAMAIFKSWFIDYEPYNRTVPNNWVEYKLGDFLPVITGKKNANVSSSIGTYPFFSCSQDITWTDEYSFEGNAILVAGNGDFNVKFYNGKFEAYQRTYVLIPHNPRLSAWLFYSVKYNLNKITAAARGSVIKFITKGNLEDFSFYAPLNLDGFDVIDQFTAINNIIASNREENACLSNLRDTLLPKLISGELDVSEIDR
ncbi:restriction endonuclease subunit S [Helcococcus bovis]|uniref:restriction endonuclease subunit S n=1 Tax=Helcococcus bovis TaxID=3153252 RepID=UPI0038B93B23